MMLYGLIGGLRGLLTAVIAASLMFALVSAYDKLVAYPAIAKAAKMEYVDLAEKMALVAQVGEAKRQKIAVENAKAIFAKSLAEIQFAAVSQDNEQTKRISVYEKLLKESGRSCLLDESDLEFVR